MRQSKRTHTIRLAQVRNAWAEYWLTTRNEIGEAYERIEPFAWQRLQARLESIGRVVVEA